MAKLTPPRIALLVWLIALALSAWRFSPPPLAADDSPHFAGQHARETLARLLPDDRPHPLGSPAQDEMRARVMAELETLGLGAQTHTLSAWACSAFGQCGYVHDIIVELPGARASTGDGGEDDSALAFVAHTDSALAGPGAGDDAHAVAILLELARHIQTGDVTPQNTILLVFTDGEEEGLLGATAFAERSPLAARTKAAVNLEARGNAGTSMLFQALGDSAWLIEAYATHARAPYCSSLAQPVYELMPNYTDLTVIHELGGIPGVDLAFTDGYAAYHSPLDTVEGLSAGALQTQGDNALAMLRGLGSADLREPPAGEAVWFDLLGLSVVRAPRGAVLPLAIALWLATMGAIFFTRSHELTQLGGVAKRFALALACLVVISALGYGLCTGLVALSGEDKPWTAHPWPVSLALVLLAPAVHLAAARWVPQGKGTQLELMLGNAALQATLGLALAYVAPAAAYVLLVPGLVLVIVIPISGRLLHLEPQRAHALAPWLCAATGLVSLILWLPLLHGLRVALGPGVHLSACAALASGWLWACYTDAQRAAAPSLALLALLGVVATGVLGPYSESAPRREWLSMVAEDGEVSVVRGPGPSHDQRLRIGGVDLSAEAEQQVSAELEALAATKAPLAKSLSKGDGHVELRLRSRRGAPSLIVSIPADAGLHSLEVGDALVPARHIRAGEDTRVEIHNVPADGVVLNATLDDPSLSWRVADRLWWLDAPAQLRSPDAQRSWDGDTTWIVTELQP